MSDRDIPQEDIIDADGNDPRTVVTRLTIVHDLLIRVNNRLLDISTRWIGPGPPDEPATLDMLNAIATESVRAKDFADVLIARITGGDTSGGTAPTGDTTSGDTTPNDKKKGKKSR